MNSSNEKMSPAETAAADYNRLNELKAFDAKKTGVKGLVDAGIVKIPKIFIRPSDQLVQELTYSKPNTEVKVPVIDLRGSKRDHFRKEIVDQVKGALEDWGFFQLVNHEIPTSVLESMINGIRMFHEQDDEVKLKYFSRDLTQNVYFHTNPDFYHNRFTCWRDTLTLNMINPDQLRPQVPVVCRDAVFEFSNEISKLGETVLELLCEALGLKPDHLKSMVIENAHRVIAGHYYPACPEPELTLGGDNHRDPSVITILLQDNIGGLQVLHKNQWIDVTPIAGSLIINVGDVLQILSNDKFKSVQHRVLSKHVGPRISIACLFGGASVLQQAYGPIKELTSEESPPLYKEYEKPDYLRDNIPISVD